MEGAPRGPASRDPHPGEFLPCWFLYPQPLLAGVSTPHGVLLRTPTHKMPLEPGTSPTTQVTKTLHYSGV